MSTGSGESIGYFVQARASLDPVLPIQVGKTFLTTEWKRVSFPEAPAPLGVSSKRLHDICPLAVQQRMFTYEAAMALMAWCAADDVMGGALVEFRLAKVNLSYSFTLEEEGVGPTIKFWEQERDVEWVRRPATEETERP